MTKHYQAFIVYFLCLSALGFIGESFRLPSAPRFINKSSFLLTARGPFNNEDNIIDVEVVDPKTKRSDQITPKRFFEEQKDNGLLGILGKTLNTVASTANTVITSLARTKDRAIQRTQEEQQKELRKRELSSEIDEIFRGTGLLGGMVGGAFKAFSGALVDALESSRSDVDAVQLAVKRALERDAEAAALLGAGLASSAPVSTASSSSS
eukprot:gene43284-52905_t